MDYFRSLWRGQNKNPQVSAEVKPLSNAPDAVVQNKVEQSTHEDVISNNHGQWDPKVVEFFKDFPEPYRQKAVERFSSREGLYRFEFIRDMAMDNEMRNALKGIFVEDQREFDEMIYRKKLEDQQEAFEKEKELFYSRDIPAWEQRVLQYIPLQPGDKMWHKLALSANLSAFGFAFLTSWWDFQKSTLRPGLKVRTLIGSAGVCGCMQVVAVYKLMDWGPFDRSVDKRSLFDKVVDDCKKDLKMILDHIDDKIKK